jgi:hypothetical protein
MSEPTDPTRVARVRKALVFQAGVYCFGLTALLNALHASAYSGVFDYLPAALADPQTGTLLLVVVGLGCFARWAMMRTSADDLPTADELPEFRVTPAPPTGQMALSSAKYFAAEGAGPLARRPAARLKVALWFVIPLLALSVVCFICAVLWLIAYVGGVSTAPYPREILFAPTAAAVAIGFGSRWLIRRIVASHTAAGPAPARRPDAW